MVAGPTGSGKTRLLMSLIDKAETVAHPKPVEIIYCYGVWQTAFGELEGKVRLHEGLIDISRDITFDGDNRWLIIDDLMQESGGKTETEYMYTKMSHHRNISVFFVVQNLFQKNNRTISLNTQYFFLFRNPRDGTSITHLA